MSTYHMDNLFEEEGEPKRYRTDGQPFWRRRRTEAVSNRGSSAYQLNALPLGQTGQFGSRFSRWSSQSARGDETHHCWPQAVCDSLGSFSFGELSVTEGAMANSKWLREEDVLGNLSNTWAPQHFCRIWRQWVELSVSWRHANSSGTPREYFRQTACSVWPCCLLGRLQT